MSSWARRDYHSRWCDNAMCAGCASSNDPHGVQRAALGGASTIDPLRTQASAPADATGVPDVAWTTAQVLELQREWERIISMTVRSMPPKPVRWFHIWEIFSFGVALGFLLAAYAIRH